MTDIKIVSSQYKHLPGRKSELIDERRISGGSALKNEPFSFQVLYRADGGVKGHRVSVGIESELPARAWRVDYVAITETAATESGNEYESKDAGLFPDILTPRPSKPEISVTGSKNDFYYEKDVDATLNASNYDYQSVWFTINPESKTLKSG